MRRDYLPPLSLEGLRHAWHDRAGYREILAIATPMILSMASSTIQHFVDRMLLYGYSPDAMTAAMPAGLSAFAFISFFLGVATYANTFVAQYHGARRFDRLAAAIWQSVWFALASFLVIAPLGLFARQILTPAGHDPEILALEIPYFRIICFGGGFSVLHGALSSFYTGRGRTLVVMWVNVMMTAINIVLDWAMIYGRWGLPRMGIEGAGWATVIATACGCVAFFALFLAPPNRAQFHTHANWRFEPALFGRLMRFGLANGVQFFVDIIAWAAFLMLVGGLGKDALWASSAVFQIDMLAFMPMVGIGVATSTLVGRYIGEGHPRISRLAAIRTMQLAVGYTLLVGVLFLSVPEQLVGIVTVMEDYDPGAPTEAVAQTADSATPGAAPAAEELNATGKRIAVVLLRFVFAFLLFDALNIVVGAALKGAGDTAFVMLAVFGVGMGVMVLPTALAVHYGIGGIYGAWTCLTAYVIMLAGLLIWRFEQGRWMRMTVIESARPEPGAPLVREPRPEFTHGEAS